MQKMWICGTMSKVEVVFKVFPKDENVDIKDLKNKIEEEILPEKIEEEPIAFGIVALKFSKIVEDKENEIEKIESKIKNISEIGEYDIISISRLPF